MTGSVGDAPDRRAVCCAVRPDQATRCGRTAYGHVRITPDHASPVHTTFLCRRHLADVRRALRRGRPPGGVAWGPAHVPASVCSHPDADWRDAGCVMPVTGLTLAGLDQTRLPQPALP